MREFLNRSGRQSPAADPPTDPDSPEPDADAAVPAAPGLRLIDLAPLLDVDGLDDDSRLVPLFAELVELVQAQAAAVDGPGLMRVELAGPAVEVAKQILVESDALSQADPAPARPAAAAVDAAERREARTAALVAAARDGIGKAAERYADTGGMTPF